MEIGRQIAILIFIALQIAIAAKSVHYEAKEPKFEKAVANITSAVGSDVTFDCRVESMESKYSVSWIYWDKHHLLTHNKVTITRDPRFSLDVLDDRIYLLRIKNIQHSDMGSYSCQINTSPLKENVGYLQVVDPEPSFVHGPPDSEAIQGITGSMECEAKYLGENNTVSWTHLGRNGNLTYGKKLLTRDPRFSIHVKDNRIFSLTIANYQAADSGRYLCQINTEPAQTKVGFLQIVVLDFKVPNPKVEAAIGTEAILICDFESNPKFETYWKRDTEGSEKIVSSYKYDSAVIGTGYKIQMRLTIRYVNPDDFGSYLCVANNSWWNRAEEKVTLIEKEPWFGEAVPDVTVVAGSDVTLPCVVESMRENYAVVWMELEKHRFLTYNNLVMTDDQRISLTVSNNRIFALKIENVQVEDTGHFACQLNTDHKQSNVAFLQVIEPFDKNAAYSEESTAKNKEPWFAKAVPNVTVVAGSDVTLPCVVQSLGENYTVTWMNLDKHRLLTSKNETMQKDPRISISVIKNRNFLLRIQNVQVEDSGRLACQLNTNPMTSNVGFLKVIEPTKSNSGTPSGDPSEEISPRIKVPNCHVAAEIGADVNLKCNLKSNPQSMTFWKLDGEGLMTYSNLKYTSKLINKGTNKVQMKLTIKNLSPDDFGIYSCVAKSYLGDNEGNIKLDRISDTPSSACPSREGVKRSNGKTPPKIRVPNQLVRAYALKDATLVCIVKSNPQPTLTWTLGDKEILDTSNKYNTSLADDGINQVKAGLMIRNIQPEDFGSYTCIARNSLGQAKGKITMFETFPDFQDYSARDEYREMHSRK